MAGITVNGIFVMLVLFQFKHLLADYYLQFPYMYENKGKLTGWKKPLLDHSLVHGLITTIVLGIFANTGNVLYIPLFVLFDISTHFVIDRWKAVKREAPDMPEFWYHLGIDQMLHHIVGILIIYGMYIAS